MAADEFGQAIRGVYVAGEAIASTDQHIAVFGKDSSGNYAYLEIGDSGGLKVDIVDATGLTFSIDQDAVTDGQAVAGNEKGMIVAGSDGTNFQFLLTDSNGALAIQDNGGSITVDATAFDIRPLTDTTDKIAIGDGTNTLAINPDGSINVNTGGSGSNNVYHAGSANLVKDTATTVVSRSPSSTENYTAIMVSGSGLCEWTVKYGTTGSEAVIMQFYTTPSNPTQYVDIPDVLTVASGETILVEGTNRERGASPASDFVGYASLIRQA